MNAATNSTQAYFGVGLAGAQTATAPLLLVNNRKKN